MKRTATIDSVALALTTASAAAPPVLRYVPKHDELKLERLSVAIDQIVSAVTAPDAAGFRRLLEAGRRRTE